VSEANACGKAQEEVFREKERCSNQFKKTLSFESVLLKTPNRPRLPYGEVSFGVHSQSRIAGVACLG
jgi:hypothetical protein